MSEPSTPRPPGGVDHVHRIRAARDELGQVEKLLSAGPAPARIR